MTTKADFTPEEWKTIAAAPPMAAFAITCASPNGPLGVMKEMLSMGMAMAEIIQKGSDNPLISALIADLKARATRLEPPANIKDAEQGKEAALARLKMAGEILDRKAASDAEEFKRWLLTIAERVAESANEGGFFGFGGERVSEAEKQTINQIAFILGLPRASAAFVTQPS
jgi:hypothetical protein